MIVQHDIDERVKPASLTKIMTAYIIAEDLKSGNIRLDDKVRISEKAWRMPGTSMFIEVGTRVTVEDLLKGVIVQSGNDASIALAEYVSGSERVFVSMMNDYARELGMKNTHFINSTGLPHKNHYTTAQDLAILTQALIRQHPEIYSLHSIKKFTYNDITQRNRNDLLWRSDTIDGVKTGWTEGAGHCLIASDKRDDTRLISIVMGTDSEHEREQASLTLLNFVFRFYDTRKAYVENETITTEKIWKGSSDILNLGVDEDIWVTVPSGEYDEINHKIILNSRLVAPVHKGSVHGHLRLVLDGRQLASEPLIALETVKQGSLYKRLKDEVILLFKHITKTDSLPKW